MLTPGMSSWQMRISGGGQLETFALWLRDVERLAVPASPLVPGPVDIEPLPPPSGEPHDARLGQEWLEWWLSLVDVGRPEPDAHLEPATDTPDPLGLARLPALRALVTRRWPEFRQWRTDHFRDPANRDRFIPRDNRTGDVVRAIERELGRRARPFELRFTLLPVRDDRIILIGPAHYLVPERVHASDRWTVWLDTIVSRVA